MERQEKSGNAYLFLALITLAFLGCVFAVTLYLRQTAPAGYTIETERAAAEAVAPVRVRVDINTADAEELDTLTGIGPALAEAIIAYRTEHGAFQSAEELLNVRGIGEAKLEGLLGEITVGGVTP